MKNNTINTILVCACAALSAACTSERAHYIESGGRQSLISTNKINMADWNASAQRMATDIINSGALDNLGKPKFYISRIINRTSQNIETDILAKQVSIALMRTGKVRIVADTQYQDNTTMVVAPQDVIMTGKIIEDRESIDGYKEVTYIFNAQLSRYGEVIWQGQQQIAKQR